MNSCDRVRTGIHSEIDLSGFHIAGVHTLSIHVRDPRTVDSIYHFLNEIFGLPGYYMPVKIGTRKYAGIYAGNMVLEPCGPYENRRYAKDDFRAIFFGINFSVNDSLKYFNESLNELNLDHQLNKGSIYIRDSLLSHENIFTALYEIRDKDKRDSLRNRLYASTDGAGIQYIQEIVVGYKGRENLRQWREYLSPLKIENNVCRINDSLRVRFTKSKINEVESITFKVTSLKKARQFLVDNRISFDSSGKRIRPDPVGIFGLTIDLTE